MKMTTDLAWARNENRPDTRVALILCGLGFITAMTTGIINKNEFDNKNIGLSVGLGVSASVAVISAIFIMLRFVFEEYGNPCPSVLPTCLADRLTHGFWRKQPAELTDIPGVTVLRPGDQTQTAIDIENQIAKQQATRAKQQATRAAADDDRLSIR